MSARIPYADEACETIRAILVAADCKSPDSADALSKAVCGRTWKELKADGNACIEMLPEFQAAIVKYGLKLTSLAASTPV